MEEKINLEELHLSPLTEEQLTEIDGGVLGLILGGCGLAITCSYYAGKAVGYALR